MIRRCSTLCLFLVVVAGCLQPVTPVPPAPTTDTLESKIKTALNTSRSKMSALASEVSITLAEADKEKLWLDGQEKIANEAANTIATAIKSSLTAAKDQETVAEVWKEVAKGYGQ